MLKDLKAKDFSRGLFPRAFAARAISQLGFVGIRAGIDHSRRSDLAPISNSDHIIGVQNVIVDLQFKSAVIRDGIIKAVLSGVQSTGANSDPNRMLIGVDKSQASAHLIVNHVVAGLTINNVNGDLELNVIANTGSVVFNSVAVFNDLLIDGGLTVFLFDSHIRIAAAQRENSVGIFRTPIGGREQIITQFLASELNRSIGSTSSLLAISGNGVTAKPCFGSGGQGSNAIRSKVFFYNDNTGSVIDAGKICITGAFNKVFNKVFPIVIDLVNNRVVGAVMGINVQNAIDFIGFTGNNILNSDSAGFCGRLICRKRRHRHGAQQGNSQQSRHEFLERLFHRL